MEIINLNRIPERYSPVAHGSQNDVGRVTRFKLFDGSTPITLNGDESIKLRIRKPNAKFVTISVANTSDDYVDVVSTQEMTDIAGDAYCKLRINDVGFKSFIYRIESNP